MDTSEAIQLRDRMGRFAGKLAASDLDEFMDNLGAEAFNNMRDEAPNDTGELVNSLRYFRQQYSTEAQISVTTNIWYDKFVRKGAKPHMVVAGLVPGLPANRDYRGMVGVPNTWPRKVLKWPGGPKYGVPVVYHNARKPNDYPERAMRATMAGISGLQKQLLSRLSSHIRGV